LEEKDRLLDTADKITFFESRLGMFENTISESQNQLMGYELKLNEHATMFGKVDQITDQHLDSFTEAVDKVTSIESRLDEFDNRISESQNQITGHESKLNEHASMFGKVSQMTVQHVANLTETSDKIKSIDSCLDGFDNKIAENKNQLTEYITKLNDHDTLLGQTFQMMGKNAANLTQVIKRIDNLEEKYQDLKAFQKTVEQTRSVILDAFNAIQTNMLPKDILTTERRSLQETRIPSGEKLSDTEDIDKSRMNLDL
jgi:chromosome segregation ATPase